LKIINKRQKTYFKKNHQGISDFFLQQSPCSNFISKMASKMSDKMAAIHPVAPEDVTLFL